MQLTKIIIAILAPFVTLYAGVNLGGILGILLDILGIAGIMTEVILWSFLRTFKM